MKFVSRNGISLIEILCAIAIIAALIAILLPVFSRARLSVSKSRCLGRLHELASAIRVWRNDHSDKLLPNLEYLKKGNEGAQDSIACPLRDDPYFYIPCYPAEADAEIYAEPPAVIEHGEHWRWSKSLLSWLRSNMDLLEAYPVVVCDEFHHSLGGEIKFVNGHEVMVVPKGQTRLVPSMKLDGSVSMQPRLNPLSRAVMNWHENHPQPIQ